MPVCCLERLYVWAGFSWVLVRSVPYTKTSGQQWYAQRHPDVRAAEVVRFRQMRLKDVVLDTPVLVGDTVFTHTILVKSPFCVACVDSSSLKNAEVRSYKGKRTMDVRTLPPAFLYKGEMCCLYRRKKTLRVNTTRWVVHTCIVDKSVV